MFSGPHSAWYQLNVWIGDERADLLRRLRLERALSEPLALVEAKASDLGFPRGDGRQAAAQFVHADAEEDGHGTGIAGDGAAHADASAERLGAPDGMRDE